MCHPTTWTGGDGCDAPVSGVALVLVKTAELAVVTAVQAGTAVARLYRRQDELEDAPPGMIIVDGELMYDCTKRGLSLEASGGFQMPEVADRKRPGVALSQATGSGSCMPTAQAWSSA